MTALSRLFGRMARLPRAEDAEVVVERDLEAKMPDGAVLLADRWYAPGSVAGAPVVLIRTPYGRRQLGMFGRLFAERGYQTIMQSCRGTFGSGGVFEPFHHESADGTATLDWIAGQAWFTGATAMFGPSYMGLTQWAVAAQPPEHLKAMAMQVTAANVRDCVVFPGGTFSLETGAFWTQQMVYQERLSKYLWALATSPRRLATVYRDLPLRDADVRAVGVTVPYYQDWLDHDRPGDPWWDPFDFSGELTKVPNCSHVAGWYDLFLPSEVEDFRRLVEAGRPARLTIGPWTHTSPGAAAASLRDALELFDATLRGRAPVDLDGRVRLQVIGSKRWVTVPSWPPPARPERWYLRSHGALAPEPPASDPPDSYRYDPADPTPSIGGPTLEPRHSGPRLQDHRENRPDVLVFSSPILPRPVTVAGPVAAEVWIRSSRPFFDVFVRLCDVDRSGRSRNVCDGILRVEPDSVRLDHAGVAQVRVAMWPTAVTFGAGHRIRVQVSSAAHPMFARNTGSGERLGDAKVMLPSVVEVFHDGDHPSAIELPVSSI